MRRLRQRLLLTLALAAAIWARPLAQKTPIVTTHQDAYIEHSSSSETWFIGNDNVRPQVGFDAGGQLLLDRLWNPATDQELAIGHTPDIGVTIGGENIALALSGPQISFVGARTEETDEGVKLTFTFEHKTLHT